MLSRQSPGRLARVTLYIYSVHMKRKSRKLARASRTVVGRPRTQAPLTLTRARQLLCPLVRDISTAPEQEIAIAVRGRVKAYLIAAEKLEQLAEKAAALDRGRVRPPRLSGTLKIVGDLEEASRRAAKELEYWALKRAADAGL